MLGQGDPLNITQTLFGSTDYSSVWDLHPVVWTEAAIKAGNRTRLSSVVQIARDYTAGLLDKPRQRASRPALWRADAAIGMLSICSTVALG